MKKEEIIIGTPVIYWSVLKANGEKFNPIETEITSEPWKLGHGEVVCKVKGVSGGVSIKHLEKIANEDSPTGISYGEYLNDLSRENR